MFSQKCCEVQVPWNIKIKIKKQCKNITLVVSEEIKMLPSALNVNSIIYTSTF